MKKAKRVTKRQKKAMIKFLEEMKANQPQPEITFKPKTRKVSKLLSLTKYLERRAQKKHDKAHHREEKRAAKEELKHKKHDHEHEHK
jgi:hypothetical protein